MSPDVTHGSALTPLLIMGSPRSGTTFLAHMVNRFFDVHVCRDNGTLLRVHRELSHYEPLSDDANLKRLIKHLYADHYVQKRLIARGLKLSEEEIFARVPQRTYGALIETILGAIAAERKKGSWGYKRASFARMTGRHFDDLFPTARFIHIIRDAREVVLSMRRSPGAALERSWHFGAVDWVSHVSKGRGIGQRIEPGRYFELRYERLMAEPAVVLTEILDFCGGGSDRDARVARIRAEVGSLVKQANTDKWRTEAAADGIRQIERVAGPLLQELGYALVNPDVAGAPVGSVEMAWLHTDRVFRNLFQSKLSVMGRYRLEVLKERWRARVRA
jgi:hypothetical protein